MNWVGIGRPIEQRWTRATCALKERAGAACVIGMLVIALGPHAHADVTPPTPRSPDYSEYTHHDLTELGARWNELSDAERRELLREVKVRMAQQKNGEGVLMIRTQRRYGRIYRNSDGRVLRIETQVVRVQPLESASDAPQRGFGVGFERRTATTVTENAPSVAPEAPPVVRINDVAQP